MKKNELMSPLNKFIFFPSFEKYNCFIVLLLLSFSFDSYAQPQYFQRIYSTSNKADTYFYDIQNSGNSNYILTGYTELFNPYRYGLYILKINNFGLPMWSKTISSLESGYVGFCMVKKNENFIIVGASDSLYILSVDSAGNEIWFKKYFQAEYRLNNLIKTNDNGFAACGTINANLGFVVKFDSLGNLIWNKTYSSGYTRNFTKIVETNNNFYLTGIRSDNSTDFGKPVITKLNLKGDMIDEKKYSFPGLSILFKDLVVKNNIITVFCGRLDIGNLRSRNFITKVNLNLDLLDTLTIQYPYQGLYRDTYERMVPYKENNYILQSYIADSTQNSFKLVDSNFNVLKYKNFSTSTILLGLFAAPDNSIFSIGVYDVDTIATELGYINKMDSNFYSGTQLINIKNENLTVNNFILLQNYPNPFNPSTKISYSLKKSSSIELKLFDINGRMIKIIESGFKSIGSYEINFSAEGLSSGIYFYSLYSTGLLIKTKKAIILK